MIRDLTVVVYNADYRVLSRIPWQEAVRLILRGVVDVVALHSPTVHARSPSVTVELPITVALRRYVHVPYIRPTRATRAGVLKRDDFVCAYCRGRADTVDHILPRSRGGGDTWLNLVAACRPCNARKDDRTPQEAGMAMFREPFEPKERDAFQQMLAE